MTNALPIELRPDAAKLPTTLVDFELRFKLKRQISLNDEVNTIIRALFEDEEFIKYQHAIYTEEAETGDLYIDDVKAAEVIQTYAVKHEFMLTGNAKLKSVIRAMNVSMRRYDSSRKQRRAAAEAVSEQVAGGTVA